MSLPSKLLRNHALLPPTSEAKPRSGGRSRALSWFVVASWLWELVSSLPERRVGIKPVPTTACCDSCEDGFSAVSECVTSEALVEETLPKMRVGAAESSGIQARRGASNDKVCPVPGPNRSPE